REGVGTLVLVGDRVRNGLLGLFRGGRSRGVSLGTGRGDLGHPATAPARPRRRFRRAGYRGPTGLGGGVRFLDGRQVLLVEAGGRSSVSLGRFLDLVVPG